MNSQTVESSKIKRNIAAIAYTELSALRADIGKAVPFYGLLTGLLTLAIPSGCLKATPRAGPRMSRS